jgi:MFS transporter, AAHS family, 4-hydroxybenzoate transporter
LTAAVHIEVARHIDRAPIGPFQIRVVLLCALVALIDGFDIQAMALVAPAIAEDWSIARAALGVVLSSSFAGIMIGAMAGGIVGDRFGRRIVLIVAFLLVGLASLLTASAGSIAELILLRVVTGIGIGACMPNFTALTAEYVPAHRVAFFITLMYSAVPLGGVMGGYIVPSLVEAYGWRSVFLLGGALPLSIALLLLAALPESIRFRVRQPESHAWVGAQLRKIDRDYRYDTSHVFSTSQSGPAGSLKLLFSGGRAPLTLLLWTIFFFSLFGMYLLTSWLPSIFDAQQWPRKLAIQSASNFQLGGIFGGVIVGLLIDRYGPYRTLGPTFLAAAVLTAAIGWFETSLSTTMTVVVLSGFAIVGAQLGMTALAASAYPTEVRATGVGWALGVGRAGAVISPFLGGLAISADWRLEHLFAGAGVAPAVCAVAIAILALVLRRQAGRTTGG